MWIKQICTYIKRTFAASWHSETRRLYPGLVVNACLKPENANNILNGFFSSGTCTSSWSIVCISQTVFLRWQFLEEDKDKQATFIFPYIWLVRKDFFMSLLVLTIHYSFSSNSALKYIKIEANEKIKQLFSHESNENSNENVVDINWSWVRISV